MTDEEIGQIVARIADDPDLRRKLGVPQPGGFFLSDNFKWLVTAIAIPLATFVFGLWQANIAGKDRAHEAALNDARNNVAAMTALLPSLADSDPTEAKLALIVLEHLKDAQRGDDNQLVQAADAMRDVIDGLQQSDDPAEQRRGAGLAEALGEATGPGRAPVGASTTPVAAARVDREPTTKPRIVYLQIFGEAQRGDAEQVQAMLRSSGVGAPGIEDVSRRLGDRMRPAPPQIRYFSDDDLGRASWLATNLPPVQGRSWTVVRTRASGVPEGQLELWWPFPAED